MGDRSSFQCLAPAKQLRGGGVVLTVLAWSSFAIIFGTFVALRNKSTSCDDACYDPSFCWSSTVTSIVPSTKCNGDAQSCIDSCWPTTSNSYEMDNATSTNSTTDDDGSYCREANRCDEMLQEEYEKINECMITACAGVSSISSFQSVMTMLGLLLILLSGTLCLNFYREAVICPPKCSPAKEAIGRVVLYGSISGAVGLMILVIVQLADFRRDGAPAGGMYDLAILVVFIYVIGINGVLVLCACGGRCLLSTDVDREVSISIDDDVEGRAEERVEEPNAQVY